VRPSSTIASALFLAASVAGARATSAQAPCSSSKILADSARDEVFAVLSSDGELAKEIRQEQGIASARDLAPITLIRDRAVCARLAGQFGHFVAPGVGFVVLRVGRLYYAREPDQRLGTGVLTDSTFHVIARFGAALPPAATVGAEARPRKP
jgi:hypothetical protein